MKVHFDSCISNKVSVYFDCDKYFSGSEEDMKFVKRLIERET
jgi:hypothetical protein